MKIKSYKDLKPGMMYCGEMFLSVALDGNLEPAGLLFWSEDTDYYGPDEHPETRREIKLRELDWVETDE